MFHPCYGACQYIILSQSWAIFFCMIYHLLFIHLWIDCHSSCFQLFAIINNAATSIYVQAFAWHWFLVLFCILRNRITGLPGNFLKKNFEVPLFICLFYCRHYYRYPLFPSTLPPPPWLLPHCCLCAWAMHICILGDYCAKPKKPVQKRQYHMIPLICAI